MVNSAVNLRSFQKVKYQYLTILCANIISISHGCGLGWLSPFLPILKSEDSPLHTGPITLEEASWIGAVLCIGGILGNIIFGFICNKYGRKRAITLIAIPQVIFWLCIIFGRYTYQLYIARTIMGLSGGGLFVCVPLFVSEIADDHIRGTLGSVLLVSCNSGILLSFIIGSFVSYTTFPFIMIALPIVFLLIFPFLPPTPQYLLKCDKVKEAEAALRFFKNIETDSKEDEQRFKEEFEKLKDSAKQNQNNGDKITIADFNGPAARRGMLIGVTLMLINQFCGCFALINYAASIFHDAGSDINPNVSSIIVASIQVLGTYTSTLLVDRAGRKILLIVSASSTSVGLFVMGLYSYLDKHDCDVSMFYWVPVASLSFVIFIASIGILPLPFVVLAEVLPERLRALGSTLCVASVSIFSFIILKTFPVLNETIGLYGCMWIFSVVCALGTIFIVFIVDETKGRSLTPVKQRCLSIY